LEKWNFNSTRKKLEKKLNIKSTESLNNQKFKTNLDVLEYELIGKHVDAYKKKLEKMSVQEIKKLAFNKIMNSLEEKNRLNKSNLKNQIIAFIGEKYLVKIEKEVDSLIK
jgi:hypothetical protein